jgi:gamma-glutamyltranspeptidase
MNQRIETIKYCEDIRRIFLVNGAVPPIGYRIIQKDLANTLTILSK